MHSARLAFDDLKALAQVGVANIAYVSGFRTTPFERVIALVVTPDSGLRLVVPTLEEEAARAALRGQATFFAWRDEDRPSQALSAGFEGISGRVEIEHEQIRVAQLELVRVAAPACEFVPADAVRERARIQKDPGELRLLRAACAILDEAYGPVADESLKSGRTEADVADDCVRFVRDEWATTGGSQPIVLTGARSALPQDSPGSTKLEPGDLVVVDFSAAFDGYFSEATRTFVVDSEPDGRQRRVLDTVHEAERASIAVARPGVPVPEVDRAAHEVIARAGHADHFVHRTDHGLGREVHEPRWLSASNPELPDVDMIVTVEPIYIPGYGGVHIEETCA